MPSGQKPPKSTRTSKKDAESNSLSSSAQVEEQVEASQQEQSGSSWRE